MSAEEIEKLKAENVARVMEDGPGLRTTTNTWVVARDPAAGLVLLGGLGAMGVGEMWLVEDEHHKHLPGYAEAPERVAEEAAPNTVILESSPVSVDPLLYRIEMAYDASTRLRALQTGAAERGAAADKTDLAKIEADIMKWLGDARAALDEAEAALRGEQKARIATAEKPEPVT